MESSRQIDDRKESRPHNTALVKVASRGFGSVLRRLATADAENRHLR